MLSSRLIAIVLSGLNVRTLVVNINQVELTAVANFETKKMSSLPGRSVVTESARSRSRKKQIIDLFNSPGRIPNRSNSDNAGRRPNLLKTKLGIPTSPQSSPDASHSVELGLGSSADHYAVTTFNRVSL